MTLVLSLIALGIWLYIGITVLTGNKFIITKVDYALMWICLILNILNDIIGGL